MADLREMLRKSNAILSSHVEQQRAEALNGLHDRGVDFTENVSEHIEEMKRMGHWPLMHMIGVLADIGLTHTLIEAIPMVKDDAA